MRVLRVLAELRPSGVEANLRATAPYWARYGIELEILATADRRGPYATVLEDAGYRVHHLPLQPAWRFTPGYLSLLRRGDYEVVHVHPERANLLTGGLARASGRRVVRSIHNVFAYQGGLRRERQVQRALLRSLGVVHVAVSTSVATAEWRYFRNPTLRLFNCYDARFRPAQPKERAVARRALGLADRDLALVSVGNCSPVKNHSVVLRALSLVGAGIPLVYLHVGLEEPDGNERAEAAALGLGDRVRFLGQVNDVAPILRAADAFVMPSRYEGMANAALEACGCGLPAILSDVPGMRDLADYIPGIFWSAPEPDSVAKAIAEVAALDPAAVAQIRRSAAAAAQQHFGIEAHVSRYRDLYADAVSPPR